MEGWDLLALTAVLVGSVLRIREYAANHPAWLDEAMLGLNILGRPCRELLSGLSFDQSGGLLYLCLTRVVSLPLGGSEFGLRLPSLLAGVGLLVLVWTVGRRIVGAESAAWATWLLAVSPLLIVYSSEAKPYAVDALVSIVLVWCAWRALRGPGDRTRMILLIVAGWLALLTSLAAPFVLAAVGIVLWADGLAESSVPKRNRAAVMAGAWFAGFVVLYLASYRHVVASGFLSAYWEVAFPFRGADWKASIVQSASAFAGGLPVPDALTRARYLIPIGVLAFVATAATNWRGAGLLGLPFLVVFAAACAQLYPLEDRLLLFTAPLGAMILAAGVTQVARSVLPRLVAVRVLGMAAVVVSLGHGSITESHRWEGRNRGVRDAMTAAARLVGTDPVLVCGSVVPEWVYYTMNWRRPDLERLRWFESTPSFQSGVFLATGTTPPDPPLQWRRAGSQGGIEMVPSPSGVGIRRGGRSEAVFDGWGSSQAEQLTALGHPVVWVLTGHRAEADALGEAWLHRGGVIEAHTAGASRFLLRLSMPH